MKPEAPVDALTLRPMSMADLDRVMAIEVQAYPFPWTRGNLIDSLAAGYVAEVLLDPDAALVGYFVAMRGVDELHLLNLTVAPHRQGQGHGRRLLAAVEARAREGRLARLWLEVRVSNERAQQMYRSRGFVQSGLRRGYYPAPGSRREDAVVMSLGIGASSGPETIDRAAGADCGT
jgi:[ribosomal protein S18]-alanine N-acetyltransferase